MTMTVSDYGWLLAGPGEGPRVEHVPSERTRGLLMLGRPVAVVWHTTASVGGGEWLARSIASRATQIPGEPRPGSASWHVLIDRDGLIIQSVALTKGANHAGKRWTHNGHTFGNANDATIGLELVNAGSVMLVGNEWRMVLNPHRPREEWQPHPSVVVPDANVSLDPAAKGFGFHDFTPHQVDSARRVVQAIKAKWPALTRASLSVGHRDIDPERKADPGDLWMDVHLPAVLSDIKT